MSDEAVEPTGEEPAVEDAGGEETREFGWGDFVSTIEDKDLRTHAERYTDPVKLIEGNLEMRKKLSNAIFRPGEDASEEDIANYRESLGIPKSYDEYQFEGITDQKDVTPEQKAFIEGWQKLFHENGVPPEAAKKINEYAVQLKEAEEKAIAEADKRFAEEMENKLREKWPGDEFDRNKKFAERAAAELLGPSFDDLKQLEDKNGRLFLDQAPVIEMLANVGREMGEGRIGTVNTETGIQDAQSKADEYRAKANEAYAKGRRAEAMKWDAKERDELAKIPR